MRIGPLLATAVLSFALSLWCSTPGLGQFKQDDTKGPQLGDTSVQRWRAGMVVTAHRGPCRGIVGTAPVPVDWPEQQVAVVEEDISPGVRVTYRMVEGTVKQMVVQIPFLRPGEEARAVITFEIRRSSLLPPENTDIYQLPERRRLPRSILAYLGPSPQIESTSPKIKALAREIGTDQDKAWDKVQAIYERVREKVEYDAAYVQRPVRGALAALASGRGDCEDLTSLFIALCRASGIPARTVWVPGHCYPEFYLVDDEAGGHWFPCQAAGSPAFGGIPEHRPVLQKGDNFRPPHDRRQRKRYLAEHLTGSGGEPRVQFIRELASP